MAGRTPFGKLARGFAVASALGTGLAAAAGAGIWIGVQCDRALGWQPSVCTAALGLVGGAAGILFVMRAIAALERSERNRERASDRQRETQDPEP